MSRDLDSALEANRYPAGLEHFAIADRWPGVDPMSVGSWEERDVHDALAIMAAEGRYQLRHKTDRGGGIDARTGVPLE